MAEASEREEALFRAGKIAGEPAYDWSNNKKNLRAEFDARFTIMGSGDVIDEITKPRELWEWIVENFSPKGNL